MKLSHEALESFRDLVRSKSGAEITLEQAQEMVSDLLGLMNLVYCKVEKRHELKLKGYRS